MAQAKRKKKFFDVEIPILGKTTQIQAYEKDEIDGRFMKYDLTRILRGKNMEMQFKIETKEERISAKPRQAKIMPYYMKRIVRKGTNYVEDSFSTECNDAEIILKPFLVTRRKVSRKVRKALREKTKAELISYIAKMNNEEIFDEIIKNKLQKTLSLKLKKIYPLSACEIRTLKVEKEFEPKEKPKVETKKEPKKEEGISEEKEAKEE
jgi:ribosomal protein S3AE